MHIADSVDVLCLDQKKHVSDGVNGSRRLWDQNISALSVCDDGLAGSIFGSFPAVNMLLMLLTPVPGRNPFKMSSDTTLKET